MEFGTLERDKVVPKLCERGLFKILKNERVFLVHLQKLYTLPAFRCLVVHRQPTKPVSKVLKQIREKSTILLENFDQVLSGYKLKGIETNFDAI